MNKIFALFVILSGIYFVTAVSFKSVQDFPVAVPPEFSDLKNFCSEFPDIKKVGFLSDIKVSEFFLYKIQNSIMPAFIQNSTENKYIICYSQTDFCKDIIDYNKFKQVKNFSNNSFENIILIERKDF